MRFDWLMNAGRAFDTPSFRNKRCSSLSYCRFIKRTVYSLDSFTHTHSHRQSYWGKSYNLLSFLSRSLPILLLVPLYLMDYGAARNWNKRIDKYKPSFLNRNNDRKKENVALFPPVITVHFHDWKRMSECIEFSHYSKCGWIMANVRRKNYALNFMLQQFE